MAVFGQRGLYTGNTDHLTRDKGLLSPNKDHIRGDEDLSTGTQDHSPDSHSRHCQRAENLRDPREEPDEHTRFIVARLGGIPCIGKWHVEEGLVNYFELPA